jgi:hypothetical protein
MKAKIKWLVEFQEKYHRREESFDCWWNFPKGSNFQIL